MASPELPRINARRWIRPTVESLERRELLSGRSAIPPNLLQQFITTLYGSSPPTPAEVKRETFVAKFIGEYTIGPPRFTDRASTIYAHSFGNSGGSNQFSKGKLQVVLFPPANPDATPTYGDPYANQVTGEATLFPQNYLETGSILILDLNGAASSEVKGLPTQLTWKYDSASGGAYTAPVGFTQGTGIAELKYYPSVDPLPGTRGSGLVIATFEGLINNSDLVNGTAKVYM